MDGGRRQRGGETMIIDQAETQLGRGESMSDTARVISRFADIAMVRTGPHEKLTEFAKYGSIPVINGLTAFSHPCQILADLMTCEEHKGRLNGQRIAWLGDSNNVLVSFIHAAALFDFELAIACPTDFMPPQEGLEERQDKGARISD